MVAQETLDTCEENQTGDNTIQGYGLHNGLKMASFQTTNRALDHQTFFENYFRQREQLPFTDRIN